MHDILNYHFMIEQGKRKTDIAITWGSDLVVFGIDLPPMNNTVQK